MTNGFGRALMARAGRIAAQAAGRAGDALLAAAEAELPPGVVVASEKDGLALSGRGLRTRYWGTARRAPDAGIRLLMASLVWRRG